MGIRIGLGLSPVLAADRLPWTPGELSSLRAWYDAELGQPKYGGDGAYVQLGGTSGDYIFTPDSAAVRITGAFEVVMRVYCNDWTAAGNQTLMGRYVTSTNLRSFRVFNNSTGTIGVAVSSDGTSGAALLSSTITPTTPLADATWFWLRTTFLPDDGGGNRVASLFTAPDTGSNYLLPVSWTANGVDTDAGVPAAHFAAATAPLEIGTFNNGTLERFSGRIGRAILYSDLSGTVVADFNASDCYGDGYWHSGGYRWNLGLPKVYDRSGNNVAPATFGSGSNQPKWLPWTGRAQVFIPSGGIANRIDVTLDPVAYVTGDLEIEFVGWRAPLGTASLFELMGPPTAGGYAVRMLGSGEPYLVYTDGTTYHNVISTVALPTYFSEGGDGCLRVRRVAASGVVTFEVKPTIADSYAVLDSVSGSTNPIYSASFYPVGGFNVNGGVTMVDVLCGDMYLRDGIDGPTVLAFNAELCGQSGYTDAYLNQWTVNRSTSGRKTVVQSPAAGTARSRISGGSDDRLTVPAAALPTFGTSGVGSVMAVQTKWATLGTNDRVLDSKASTSATAAGFYVGSGATAADLVVNAGDGTNQANSTATTALVSGQRQVVGLTVSATQVQAFVNNTFATAASRPTNSMDSGGDLTVLANSTGAEYSDAVLDAVIVRGAEHTAADEALMVAYYGGGL